MLSRGFPKSLIEPHWLTVLWVFFILQKPQQNWLFPVTNRKFQEFQKSGLNGLNGLNETCVCGWNLSEYTIMEQQAGCNRRVQEVVRVKQRKKKIRIESFSNGLNHRGSICGVRFGSDLFGGVALRASVCEFSDIWSVFGCEGFWSSALADDFFPAAGPPWFFSSLKRPRRFFSGCCLRQ